MPKEEFKPNYTTTKLLAQIHVVVCHKEPRSYSVLNPIHGEPVAAFLDENLAWRQIVIYEAYNALKPKPYECPSKHAEWIANHPCKSKQEIMHYSIINVPLAHEPLPE